MSQKAKEESTSMKNGKTQLYKQMSDKMTEKNEHQMEQYGGHFCRVMGQKPN